MSNQMPADHGRSTDHQGTAPTPPPPPPPMASDAAAALPAQGARPAELLDRFLARLIDWVILVVVNVLVVFVVVVGVLIGTGSGFLGSAVSAVLSAVIALGYFAWMESTQGATVGKQLLKLRTVGPTGEKPTFEQAVRRNIWCGLSALGIIPILGSLVGGIAAIAAVVMIAMGISQDTANRQAWHDRFAGGTRVLKVG